MVASCLAASVAQFAPLPFPESRPVLGICGALYFLISGVLQWIVTYVDQDTILWTLPFQKPQSPKTSKTTATTPPTNPLLSKFGCRVRTDFPRFSEFYTVRLEIAVRDERTNQLVVHPTQVVSQTWSVGQFFDKDGYFYETGVLDEIKALFAKLQRAEYDPPKKTKEADAKKTKKE